MGRRGTLQERIGRGPLDPREEAETVRDLTLAVAEAYAMGIVHRDLKPANVFLAASGAVGAKCVPKLADFGLARYGDGDGMTETGTMLGTPGYMAPEQAGLCPSAGEVGLATDVHGRGAILHACLTERPPSDGPSSWDKLIGSARGAPASVRDSRGDVPRDLATIVAKCLQASLARRYRSAGELADDLGRFLEGRPVRARPISMPEWGWKWARRRPATAAATALLVLAGIATLAGTAFHVASIDRALQDVATEQERARGALATAT